MAVLLVGLEEGLATALVTRLVKEGDEARLLTRDDRVAGEMKSLGAHIASGQAWDADLIERAAQNVRTIVVGEAHDEDPGALLEAVVGGGELAVPDMRVVAVGRGLRAEHVEILRSSALDYVTLRIPPRRGPLGWRSKRALDAGDLAEAIDAADDLSGNPRLELDLSDPNDWRKLVLEPPT